jgi:hypothetical protein
MRQDPVNPLRGGPLRSGFRGWSALSVILLLVAVPALAQPADLPSSVYDATAPGVVLIEASECPGRSGTLLSQGMVHETPGEIITVLHGIAGCQRVKVTIFGGEAYTRIVHQGMAQPVKYLMKADLALLRLESSPPLTKADWPAPLPVAPPPTPQPGTDIYAIGRMDAGGGGAPRAF